MFLPFAHGGRGINCLYGGDYSLGTILEISCYTASPFSVSTIHYCSITLRISSTRFWAAPCHLFEADDPATYAHLNWCSLFNNLCFAIATQGILSKIVSSKILGCMSYLLVGMRCTLIPSRISIGTPCLKLWNARIFKSRSQIFGAILAIFFIGNRILNLPTAVPVSGWAAIFFTLSSICYPTLQTPLVCTPRDHFPGIPTACIELLSSLSYNTYLISVSIKIF